MEAEKVSKEQVTASLREVVSFLERADRILPTIRAMLAHLERDTAKCPDCGRSHPSTPSGIACSNSSGYAEAEPIEPERNEKTSLTLVPKAPVQRRQDPNRAAIQTVFAYWARVLEHPGARLTGDREQKIRARLRDGYTVDDMLRAIDGCAASPYHCGENDQKTRYDDLTLILRNGSFLEKFREKAPALEEQVEAAPERSAEDREREREIVALRQQARSLLAQGRTAEYAETQAKIREMMGKTR